MSMGDNDLAYMASALAEKVGVESRSAGSFPARRPQPMVVTAMRQYGIDLSTCIPRIATEEELAWADCVVTIGHENTWHLPPKTRVFNWRIDSTGRANSNYMDELVTKIRRLVAQLVADAAGLPALLEQNHCASKTMHA